MGEGNDDDDGDESVDETPWWDDGIWIDPRRRSGWIVECVLRREAHTHGLIKSRSFREGLENLFNGVGD